MMYLILSDRSTYDREGFVALLTEGGESDLSDNLDFKAVSEDDIIAEISLDDLIDAFNKVHGTEY